MRPSEFGDFSTARLRSLVSISLAIGRNDPVADLIEHREGVVELLIEGLRPDEARGLRLDQFDRHGKPVAVRAARLRSTT